MGILNNWYKQIKELKKENEYYTRECYLKEKRIRELKKEVKDLKNEIEELKKRGNGNEKIKSKRKSAAISKRL